LETDMLELLQSLSGLQLIGLAAILGLVVILTPTLMISQWRKASQARRDANLKRDMLARGLSVDEIDRLTVPVSVREAQVEADSRVREAQIDADLKRDLAARGLSVEDIQRLTSQQDEKHRVNEVAGALAGATVNMVQDGALDYDAVEALLATFLEKRTSTDDRLARPNPAAPLMQQAQQEIRLNGNGSRDSTIPVDVTM
jgi:hypothetical protein